MARVTREELDKQYDTNEIDCITSPGKYEGEPLYVPYLWEEYAIYDHGFERIITHTQTVDIIKIDEGMVSEFPELEGVEYVSLSEDKGFVHSEALESEEELEELEKRAEELREEHEVQEDL